MPARRKSLGLLNTAYKDAGVQLRWIVPTDLFLEIGGEILRGDSFPAADAAASGGTGASTLFVHAGGDAGTSSSWRAGIAYLTADANGRTAVFDPGSVAFTGTSDLTIADFVWKWAKNGNSRDRYYVVQAEYMHRREAGEVALTPLAGTPETGPYNGTQNGFYIQGVYQFRPRWRIGARFDRLDASNDIGVITPTPLTADHRTRRISLRCATRSVSATCWKPTND